MVPTLQQLGIDTLSPEDRFALAQALWDSCPRLPGRAADCSRGAPEMERRAALADADPSRGVPWESVRATAQGRWQHPH